MTSVPAPQSQNTGFTLIEFIVVIFTVTLLATIVLILVRPEEIRKRSHDVVRLADLGILMQAIERYVLKYGIPPDSVGVTRVSNVAVGGESVCQADGSGWIGADLSRYLSALPADILNEEPYLYRYRHDGIYYELNATLEYHLELMDNESDGGDNEERYERGTDLTLLE